MALQSKAVQTNLVLIANNEVDTRKFIVWNTETANNTEVLSQLQISRISVENQKKMFEHPLENGATIVDYEILDPKRVNIQAYIANDDTATLNELEQLYLNGTQLRLRAENKILNNMVIAAQPLEITSSMLDKNLYSISFKEAQYVMPQYVGMPNAKKKSNTSRVNSGIKQAQKVEKPKSWLASLFTGGRS